ncbi:hypothetical protein Q8W67_24470 [Methylobacterium sp. NEAU K]|nr:hypothetical protein [Methylobacterium sp. NEAU K]MDP4006561.1 hypothetical protein [Methylobacterium sp. NEAU K]
MRNTLLMAFFVISATPAIAQPSSSSVRPLGVRPPVLIEGLGPGFEDNGGPGAVTVIVQGRSGTGASTIVDDSAAGGNSEQPERAVPQFGGGGGAGGGGGGQ